MVETSPRRWLAIRRKIHNVDDSALLKILKIFEQALETTDKFMPLSNASDKIKTTERWFLNHRMQFHDYSSGEKFWFTYVEESGKLRRITVSCDYRNALTESLENDLQALRFQRDKSALIYESISMSLPDIQFYDTVTNLRLQTVDDRLQVHVTEDANEIASNFKIDETNTDYITYIKARRFVMAITLKDLYAATRRKRCTAAPVRISCNSDYPSLLSPRTPAMQSVLNDFVNDCLRGMTRCRSSITTCGRFT